MKFTRLFLMAAALGLGGSAMPLFAQTGTADAQVEEAKQLLTQERFIEALAAAKEAARLDAGDYRARYYVAMAYMGLRQFEAAESEAAQALAQAPASDRPAVEKLMATIRSLSQGTASVSGADAALAEGLIGKAARLYEEAWLAGRNVPDLAFKAADLYASRLGQPVDAARVLRQVQQSLPGSTAFDNAQTKLTAMATQLRDIATARVREAASMDWAGAAPLLQAAEAADPSYDAIYLTRVRLAARDGSVSLVQDGVKELARRNLVTVEDMARLPNIDRMMAQSEFAQFMVDVMGNALAEQLSAAVTPVGRAGVLARLAGQGKINFFVGANREGNSYYRYSRRVITGVRQDGGCQTTFYLGNVIEMSSDLKAQLTSRVIDWRAMPRPSLDGSYVELGPNAEGWLTTGISVNDTADVARTVFDAVAGLQQACPPLPAPVKKR